MLAPRFVSLACSCSPGLLRVLQTPASAKRLLAVLAACVQKRIICMSAYRLAPSPHSGIADAVATVRARRRRLQQRVSPADQATCLSPLTYLRAFFSSQPLAASKG